MNVINSIDITSRSESAIAELEAKLKKLAEKSRSFDDDKKAATASLEEKLKSMSRQRTTAGS